MPPGDHRSATEEFDVVVLAIQPEAVDVVALEFGRRDGVPLPKWEPGAHVDLLLAPGLERQYSLCGDPFGATWRVAVLLEHEGRGGSARVHGLSVADSLRVRGPRNHFPLVAAPGYLFIAGGIGITPIIPMIGQVERERLPWHLLYGGRRRESMAFIGLLGKYDDLVTLRPQDEYGLLELEQAIDGLAVGEALYCCGPEPLITAVEQICVQLSLPRPHVERFAPKAIDPAKAAGDRAFDVVIDSTGMTYRVQADESIMEVLERNGFDIDYSCREGICGTCETYVLEGEITHRDSVLSGDEQDAQDTMMICVSRAAYDRLVLDL